jgi:putative SOS response-associated peptidase YedK
MTEGDPPGSPGQGFLYPRLTEAYEGVTCWTYASTAMGAAQRIPTHVLTALWEQGHPPDGALIESCTSLTTEPNEWLRPIHNQMPVIPSPASYDQWLDPTCQQAESLKALLRPDASEELLAYSVGTLVNQPATRRPLCGKGSD